MQIPVSYKALRIALCLDQVKMANLLGISRAQLSMAESRRRRLPPKALLRSVRINTLLENFGSSDNATSALSVESKKEILSGMLTQLKAEDNKLLRKQKLLLNQRSNENLLLTFLSHFEVLQNPDFDPEGDRLWSESIKKNLPTRNAEKEWQEIYTLNLELEALRFKTGQIEKDLK